MSCGGMFNVLGHNTFFKELPFLKNIFVNCVFGEFLKNGSNIKR